MPIIYDFTEEQYKKLVRNNKGVCITSSCDHSELVAYLDIKETVKRLVALRKKHKLTISKLSNAVQISEESLVSIENGESLLDVKWLKLFSNFYGVTVEYLLAEDVQLEQMTLFNY